MYRVLLAGLILAVGCSKPLNKSTEASVEQVPGVKWYSANRDASVFTISTAEELAGLAQIVNGTWGGKPARDNFFGKTIKLTANINLYGYENWIPIGNYGFDPISVFSGTFDGGGHVVSGLNIDRLPTAGSDSDLNYRNNYLGLFGHIRNGRVENLGLDSVNIQGFNNIGGIAGLISNNSIIINSYSSGNIFGKQDNVGGVVGSIIENSSLINCYSTGVIEGGKNVGGVAGAVENHSHITSCYSTSAVTSWNNIGGIAAKISGKSSVTNCIALNLALISNYNYALAGRVVGTFEDDVFEDAVLLNNAAHNGMENLEGYTGWYTKRQKRNDHNGTDISTAELLADGTLGGRFKDGWTTKNGYLPGFGEAIAFPPHLHKEAQTEMFNTNWYTSNPNATNFTISTASELAGLAQIVNGTWDEKPYNFKGKTITLVADIDLSRYHNWFPIGNSSYRPFSGTFDGGWHVISKLTIKSSDYYWERGLFGYITGGHVKNLGLDNVDIKGSRNIGAVVGYIEYGSIANCYSKGTVSGKTNVGGIAGVVYNTSVVNCYSTVAISGGGYIGGIAGYIRDGSRVANCKALNPYVKSGEKKNDFAGRIIGVNGTIENTKDYKIYGILSNNAASAEMKNRFGNTEWLYKGADDLDGEDITEKTE